MSFRSYFTVFLVGWTVPSVVCCVYVDNEPISPAVRVTSGSLEVDAQFGDGTFESLAQTDPGALLELAAKKYESEVRSYRCMFWRRERVGSVMSARQGIEVLFRDSPRAIMMIWRHNPGRIRRAVYVEGHDVSADGEPCAIVEPANALLRLCASRVAIPIHGVQARATSRYPMDEFGIRATLARIRAVNRVAAAAGDLDLRYEGRGEVGGRATLVLVRRLPYTGPGSVYPDSRLVIHLDREHLYPIAVYAFADAAGEVLLGSYVLTDLKLNPQLDDETFKL